MFINRDITRADITTMVRQALIETSGNYRAVLQLLGHGAERLQAVLEFPLDARLHRRLPRVPLRQGLARAADGAAVPDPVGARAAKGDAADAEAEPNGMMSFLRSLKAADGELRGPSSTPAR